MPKRVLDVGQCAPDHAAIRRLVAGTFDAEVVQADRLDDALAALRQETFDLVLINRKLDIDYSDGIEILRAIKTDPAISSMPVMLVTNYPEYQQAAIAAGGEPGFGKAELERAETREKLGRFLGASSVEG
ncbi:MAG TPA: response regulator [Pirellulales bacterium]|nr:response regulator [Pirellulales bacterium]